MAAPDSLQVKPDRIDADKAVSEMVQEESNMDEVELPDDVAESKQPRAAIIGAVQPEDAVLAVQTDDEIEEQLLSIIKLKQSGDMNWVTQLEKFKQTYPDYPLPEELSN